MTNLTDEQWQLLCPVLEIARELQKGGRPRNYPLREIVNGILYHQDGLPMADAAVGFWALEFSLWVLYCLANRLLNVLLPGLGTPGGFLKDYDRLTDTAKVIIKITEVLCLYEEFVSFLNSHLVTK
ncbi:MAG: transposase [Methylobacter sp.]